MDWTVQRTTWDGSNPRGMVRGEPLVMIRIQALSNYYLHIGYSLALHCITARSLLRPYFQVPLVRLDTGRAVEALRRRLGIEIYRITSLLV